jgi:hypothetical protein
MRCAARRTSSSCAANSGSSGASTPRRVAPGTASRSSSSRFAASVPCAAISTPVMLPPGRARLCTRPRRSGSKLPKITIGIVDVASRAAIAAVEPTATITFGLAATSSRASAGSRSRRPSAKRSSNVRLRPASYPRRAIESRNIHDASRLGFGEVARSTPTTARGLAGACASAGTASTAASEASARRRDVIG